MQIRLRARKRHRDAVLWKKRRQRQGGSPPTYAAGQIGDVDTVTLEILFSEPVQAADFTAGVTIKVDTVSQVITSGTLQGDNQTVYYVIPAVDVNDTITWEYAQAAGGIQDLAGAPLADVSAQAAINYIGSQFYFNDFNSSGHFAHL
jgi:hypothetical protein